MKMSIAMWRYYSWPQDIPGCEQHRHGTCWKEWCLMTGQRRHASHTGRNLTFIIGRWTSVSPQVICDHKCTGPQAQCASYKDWQFSKRQIISVYRSIGSVRSVAHELTRKSHVVGSSHHLLTGKDWSWCFSFRQKYVGKKTPEKNGAKSPKRNIFEYLLLILT